MGAGAPGGGMNEKELKIGDIARLTGISEQDVRTLVQTYDSLFTYRTIGPVKLFPERAVRIVRELIELSEKGLTPEDIAEEVRSGGKSVAPEEPAGEIGRVGTPLPPEVAIDFRVMQDTLAMQERRIARLTAELEQERELRREEAGRLVQALEDLREQVERQREQLAIVAEWVDYFDLQMDEATRPALERVLRAFGKTNGPGKSAGRTG